MARPLASNPTPEEILARRAEIHRQRGEHTLADLLLKQPIVDDEPEELAREPAMRSIHEIGLPTRITRPLEEAGVLLAGDLCGWTEERLRRFRQFSTGSISLIRSALALVGLALRQSLPGEIAAPVPPPKMLKRESVSMHTFRITDEQRERMFVLIARGMSQRDIAPTMGVSRWAVWNQLRLLKESVRAMLDAGDSEEQVRDRIGSDRWSVWQRSRRWDAGKPRALAAA